MNLDIQLQSAIGSLLFGMFFALQFNLFYTLIFKKKLIVTIISNLVVVILNVCGYFFIMFKINGGIIHIYFLTFLLIGFYISNKKTNILRNIFKNKISNS